MQRRKSVSRRKKAVTKRPPGRPRRQANMERIAVYIPRNLKRWLKHRSIDEGKDMGELVTAAIKAYRSQR